MSDSPWWFPSVRRGPQRLCHDQGFVPWCQEEGRHPQEVSIPAHHPPVTGEGRAQVDRHVIQVRPRKLPDEGREARVPGHAQEGHHYLDEVKTWGSGVLVFLRVPFSALWIGMIKKNRCSYITLRRICSFGKLYSCHSTKL